jgi:hypothetical protein
MCRGSLQTGGEGRVLELPQGPEVRRLDLSHSLLEVIADDSTTRMAVRR